MMQETVTKRTGDPALGRRIVLLRGPRSRADFVASLNHHVGSRDQYKVEWLKQVELGNKAITVAALEVVSAVLGVSMDAIARGSEADSLESITAPYEGRIGAERKELLRRLLADWAQE